jgi:hypothetical protein
MVNQRIAIEPRIFVVPPLGPVELWDVEHQTPMIGARLFNFYLVKNASPDGLVSLKPEFAAP